jgi:hypothetical protein
VPDAILSISFDDHQREIIRVGICALTRIGTAISDRVPGRPLELCQWASPFRYLSPRLNRGNVPTPEVLEVTPTFEGLDFGRRFRFSAVFRFQVQEFKRDGLFAVHREHQAVTG